MSTIDWKKPLETVKGSVPVVAAPLADGYAVCLPEDPAYLWFVRPDGTPDQRLNATDDDVCNVPTVDDEGHTPTPHEPVKGVTLWNTIDCGPQSAAYVRVDGGPVVAILRPDKIGESKDRDDATVAHVPCDDSYVARMGWLDDLRAFRDRIRAERAAKRAAAPWTFETMPVAVKVRHKVQKWKRVAHPYSDICVEMTNVDHNVTFADLLRDYEQLDGSPCGLTPA